MLNDVLLSFFFGMPAIVGLATAHELRTSLGRSLMFLGGALAVILVSLVVLPMLACDGHLMKPHTSCFGGAGIVSLANTLAPITKTAAMAYILLLFPLGVLLRAADSFAGRRVSGV